MLSTDSLLVFLETAWLREMGVMNTQNESL